jgi:hypothetical protein
MRPGISRTKAGFALNLERRIQLEPLTLRLDQAIDRAIRAVPLARSACSSAFPPKWKLYLRMAVDRRIEILAAVQVLTRELTSCRNISVGYSAARNAR